MLPACHYLHRNSCSASVDIVKVLVQGHIVSKGRDMAPSICTRGVLKVRYSVHVRATFYTRLHSSLYSIYAHTGLFDFDLFLLNEAEWFQKAQITEDPRSDPKLPRYLPKLPGLLARTMVHCSPTFYSGFVLPLLMCTAMVPFYSAVHRVVVLTFLLQDAFSLTSRCSSGT